MRKKAGKNRSFLCSLLVVLCSLAGFPLSLAGQSVEAARALSFGRFSGDAQVYPDSAIDRIRAAKIAGREALTLVLMSLKTETVRLESDRDIGAEGLVLGAANSPARVVISGRKGEIILEEGSGSLIAVESGVTLTLRHITLREARVDPEGAPLVRVGSGGCLILATGAAIEGLDDSGVYVEDGGALVTANK
jgi:hypothetical protein